MKKFSHALLAAVLTTGVAGGALLAEPAIAQKKKDKDDGKLKLSPAALKAAQTAQPALAANDFATAEPAVAQVEAAATNDDDKYIAAALRYELETRKLVQQQTANPNAPLDESKLGAPLQALLASVKTPPADKPRYAYRLGTLAFNAKQYPQALQYLNQARQLGSTEGNLGLLIVRAKESSGDVAGALADLGAEIDRQAAAGQKASEEQYRYGLARSFKVPGQALPWMQKYLTAYPTPKNWRDVVITYGFAPGAPVQLDTPQKIDLFRLLRTSKSLADQYDYGEYAQKTRDRGLPAESLAVLREGIAAGKIPAGNTEYKAMLAEVTRQTAAEGSLAPLETKAKGASDGKLASQTAEAYLSQGNYAKAAELYRAALSKGNVNADEVNTRLGIALANSGDKEGARAAFAAVKGAPRADIAALWTAWLNASA